MVIFRKFVIRKNNFAKKYRKEQRNLFRYVIRKKMENRMLHISDRVLS